MNLNVKRQLSFCFLDKKNLIKAILGATQVFWKDNFENFWTKTSTKNCWGKSFKKNNNKSSREFNSSNTSNHTPKPTTNNTFLEKMKRLCKNSFLTDFKHPSFLCLVICILSILFFFCKNVAGEINGIERFPMDVGLQILFCFFLIFMLKRHSTSPKQIFFQGQKTKLVY